MKSEKQKTKRSLIDNFGDQIKLITRLMKDERVNILLKLLPFGSLVYFISPFDFPTPIDDIGVIWFFTQLFLEMCPEDVVREHQIAIDQSYYGKQEDQENGFEFPEGDVVDAEFKDNVD